MSGELKTHHRRPQTLSSLLTSLGLRALDSFPEGLRLFAPWSEIRSCLLLSQTWDSGPRFWQGLAHVGENHLRQMLGTGPLGLGFRRKLEVFNIPFASRFNLGHCRNPKARLAARGAVGTHLGFQRLGRQWSVQPP